MAETSVILFELLHGWNRVNIDYMKNSSSIAVCDVHPSTLSEPELTPSSRLYSLATIAPPRPGSCGLN